MFFRGSVFARNSRSREGSYRMKMSSLKISLRSSGERSRLSHTICRIRCLNVFFPESEDRELVAGEVTCAETPFFVNDSDMFNRLRLTIFLRKPSTSFSCLPSPTFSHSFIWETFFNPTFELRISRAYGSMTSMPREESLSNEQSPGVPIWRY